MFQPAPPLPESSSSDESETELNEEGVDFPLQEGEEDGEMNQNTTATTSSPVRKLFEDPITPRPIQSSPLGIPALRSASPSLDTSLYLLQVKNKTKHKIK